MADATIQLTEGSRHNVVLIVPNDISLTAYNAKIEVKTKETSTTNLYTFSTIDNSLIKNISTISGSTVQQVLLQINASATEGKNGNYKWQLILWSTVDDVIKFPIQNFIIKPSITTI